LDIELTEQTRFALDEYLRLSGRKSGDFLFAGRGGRDRGLTTDNTRVWSVNGSRPSASTPQNTARIHFDEPKRR